MRQFIIILAAFSLAAIPVSATVIHVPGDYATIQDGIDAAVDGDTVLVADGTYTGDGNRDIDFGGKAITVTSENGPEFTIIDCEGSEYANHRAFKFHSGESSDAILDGLTIRNGYGHYDGMGDLNVGGGIYCSYSSPTISNCIISDNYAISRGGGLYCEDSSPILIECTFSDNYANVGAGIYYNGSLLTIVDCSFISNSTNSGGGGGGINCSANSSLFIVDCLFSENFGGLGGGISCDNASLSLQNCVFNGNTAGFGAGLYSEYSSIVTENCNFTSNSGSQSGGGAYCYQSSLMMTDCNFSGNSSYDGGGFSCNQSSPVLTECEFDGNYAQSNGGGIDCINNSVPTLTNCRILDNSAGGNGGGVFCRDGSSPIISYCAFINNSADDAGGAIFFPTNSEPCLTNCTLSGNSSPNGGGIACIAPSSPTLENCIIAFCPQGEAILGSSPTLSCCDIYGNAGGDWVGYIAPQYGENGNFSEDPLFCDTSYNVLTLTNNSPCAPDNNSCGVLIGAYEVSCSGMYNFSLITPPTDSLYLHTPDEFMWHSTTDVDSGFPASYRFYIDDDPFFGSPDSSEVLSDTTYSLSDTLSRSILYYWRVLAFNDFAIPRFSAETWNLYVDGYPGMTEIIAPCDGSVVDSTTYFAWLITTDPDSFDAVTYSIQMDDDPLFDSPEIDQSGLGSGLLLDDAFTIRLGELNGFENLIPGTVYYWRVRSDDLYGLSSDWTDGTNYVIFLVQTGINDDEDRLPNTFFISQNYPNPFNARTTIEYGLPEASHVTIKIYNLLGGMVETLVDQDRQAGYHRIVWDARMQPSGIYFYWVHAGDHIETNKMVLLK